MAAIAPAACWVESAIRISRLATSPETAPESNAVEVSLTPQGSGWSLQTWTALAEKPGFGKVKRRREIEPHHQLGRLRFTHKLARSSTDDLML